MNPDKLLSNENRDGSRQVLDEQPVLMGVAYRLLGSVSDAQDAVQEGYARWYALADGERQAIRNPAGWLVTVVSRICLDTLTSARSRRETYPGTWLPEPLPGSASWAHRGTPREMRDPAEVAELNESVSMALMVVLETMTPAERVAFILHDVFRYAFVDIAEILGRSVGASRQLAASARQRVQRSLPFHSTSAQQQRLVHAFHHAWKTGDLGALLSILDPEVTAVADGGGRVPVASKPIHGASEVARYLLEIASRQDHFTIVEESVNGAPGLTTWSNGALQATLAFAVHEGQIRKIWAVRDPEKLAHWVA